MYARVTTTQVRPGKMDEAISVIRDSTYSAHRNRRGFKSAILLTNGTTGKALSITLWETEAGATVQAAVTDSGNTRLLTRPSVQEIFEVSVRVVSPAEARL